MDDLRFALRRLTKAPGFTAVVVFSLAVGIGANATVWCWIDNLVRRPLPGVARQDEMVVLVSNQGGGGVSLPDLGDFAALQGIFDGALAAQNTPASLMVDGRPEWINAEVVSANFFDVLEIRPILGRTFVREEDQKPGGNPVLVISESLWRRRFAADPGIVGRVVDLNRHSFTIVGVAPASFRGTMTAFTFDAWAPSSMIWEVRNQQADTDRRSARGWHNLARLRGGKSVAQAQAAVETTNGQLAHAYPRTNTGVRHRVLPYSECPYGAQAVMGPVLKLLQAVSLGVLLIVAANVANLLLARATSRQKEIAIRLAIGVGRVRLVRLLLAESLLLALLGGGLGALLASRAVDVIPLFLPAVPSGVVLDYSLNGSTLVFTLLLTLATGVVFGLVSAVQATRLRVYETLKEGGRSSASGAHHRSRNLLVVAETALAVVLLVGAGLCVQGLRKARQTHLGLDPDHVLTAGLQIGMHGYTRETGPVFYRQLRERLAALPGVEETALASWFPLGLGGCKGADVFVEGYVRPRGEDSTYEYAIVSPRYFAVLRIPLLAGRDFTEADDDGAQHVAIVNEAFAARFWPEQDPLGRRFRTQGQWRTVIGLARNGRYNRLDEGQWPFFYRPYQQGVPDLDLSVALRSAGDPEALAETLRGAVRRLDPGVELLRTLPLRSHVEAVFFPQRMASSMLLLLGAVAVVLAAMGVYGVMAYAVSQRTQEFGIRRALGATAGDVLWQVLRQGLGLAAFGVALGLALALALSRLLASFLYGVSRFDPVTLLGVPLFLAGVVLLACALPARRATRVDPMLALRCE